MEIGPHLRGFLLQLHFQSGDDLSIRFDALMGAVCQGLAALNRLKDVFSFFSGLRI